MIMETRLNIAEILKDKPVNTRLYSPIFGNCILVLPEDMIIKDKSGEIRYFYDDGRFIKTGESLLFPSKEMRDWSKFAWKKGDVLVNSDKSLYIIFEKFDDDTYISFKGKHYLWKGGDEEDYSKEEANMTTSLFEKANDESAQAYINAIEKRLGGKLNLTTLEIEKAQPEFKDGDILCVIDNSNDYHYILIYERQDDKHIHRYITMLEDNSLNMTKGSYLTKPKDYSTRYATEEEKQQLFDALAKEGKAWDAEKKEIVDLKPKVKFKPFDKVVAYCEILEGWSCDIFSHYAKNYEGKEVIVCLGGGTYYKALPFNEETAKLLGTTKNVEY